MYKLLPIAVCLCIPGLANAQNLINQVDQNTQQILDLSKKIDSLTAKVDALAMQMARIEAKLDKADKVSTDVVKVEPKSPAYLDKPSAQACTGGQCTVAGQCGMSQCACPSTTGTTYYTAPQTYTYYTYPAQTYYYSDQATSSCANGQCGSSRGIFRRFR